MAGRPSKLNETFLKALREVIEDPLRAFLFYDYELLEMANDKLDEKDRIAEITFKEYKAGKELKSVETNVLDEFTYLIKKARSKMTLNLVEKMLDQDNSAWQRYAWLLERKRDDLNIRKKHEVSAKVQVVDFDYEEVDEE